MLLRATFGVQGGEKAREEMRTARNLVTLGVMGGPLQERCSSRRGMKEMEGLTKIRGTSSEVSPSWLIPWLNGCRLGTARDFSGFNAERSNSKNSRKALS